MRAVVSGAGQQLVLAIDLTQSGSSVTGTLAAVAPSTAQEGE